jgi:hypothetical protein
LRKFGKGNLDSNIYLKTIIRYLMKKLTSFEDHLNIRYGKKGTARREKFESESLVFRLREMLKKERR